MGMVQNKDLKTRPPLWTLFGTTSGPPDLPHVKKLKKCVVIYACILASELKLSVQLFHFFLWAHKLHHSIDIIKILFSFFLLGGGGSNPERSPMEGQGKGAAGGQEGVQREDNRGIQCEGQRFGGPFLHVGSGCSLYMRAQSITTSRYIVSRCMLKESLIEGLFVLQVTILATSLGVSKESNSFMMFSCSRFRIISISLCKFFSSFSDLPTFGINFNATT